MFMRYELARFEKTSQKINKYLRHKSRLSHNIKKPLITILFHACYIKDFRNKLLHREGVQMLTARSSLVMFDSNVLDD